MNKHKLKKNQTDSEIIFEKQWRHEMHTDNMYLMKGFISYLVTEQFHLHAIMLVREKTILFGFRK